MGFAVMRVARVEQGGYAAGGVAAHTAFRAVGVEHPHAAVGVGPRRWADEHYPVTSDAKVAVAHFAGEVGERSGSDSIQSIYM